LTTPLQNPLTACVIDDDKIFIFGLKKLLQFSGLNIALTAFTSGKEALEFLTNPENALSLPDIIFLDLNMPWMSGWEFLDAFEEIQSQLGKKITIYNVSSSVDLNDIERAKRNPLIKDYLLKPINETHLAAIYNSFRAGEQQAESVWI
jgi:CheY-like chemotaxis protein